MASGGEKQVELVFRTWGGRREGAGRKPATGRARRLGHGARPRLGKGIPVHITMRLARGIPSLRSQVLYAAFRKSLALASKDLIRVTSFSLQRDHIHLIVEAPHARRLGNAMRGLASGFARRLNGILGRRGRHVFGDRYHRHDLETPRQVRNALVYVVQNGSKHEPLLVHRELLDPFSSGAYFDGWSPRMRLRSCVPDDPPPVVAPKFWLLTTGWKRRGLIDPGERPIPKGPPPIPFP